jgi:hypothetical protein
MGEKISIFNKIKTDFLEAPLLWTIVVVLIIWNIIQANAIDEAKNRADYAVDFADAVNSDAYLYTDRQIDDLRHETYDIAEEVVYNLGEDIVYDTLRGW